MLSLIISTLVSAATPQSPIWIVEWPDTAVTPWINRGLRHGCQDCPNSELNKLERKSFRPDKPFCRRSVHLGARTPSQEMLSALVLASLLCQICLMRFPLHLMSQKRMMTELGYLRQAPQPFGADLPLDVFGKGVAQNQAARLNAAATSQDEKSVQIALSLQIAGAYYDVLSAKAQLTIVQDQLLSNRKLLELTTLRQQRGEASALDVLQQEQQLAALEGQLPRAETLDSNQMLRLEMLCGGKSDFSAPTGELPTLDQFPSKTGRRSLSSAQILLLLATV